jgi:biopolymer transport protein ExbB/TolQ
MFTVAALSQMWANAWPVISVLLFCSVFSLAVILERWFSLGHWSFDREALLAQIRRPLVERRREQAQGFCTGLKTPIGTILGILLSHPGSMRATERESLDRLAQRLVRSEAAKMLRYVTLLGTIGSVAPFIGLFGTVVGIIHAFKAIAENAGGGPGVVANGIAEALITTALGLFVAIPAVVAYNMFIRKIERVTEDMDLCTEEVIDLSAAG